jgi:hypothetical protein
MGAPLVADTSLAEQLAQVVIRGLAAGKTVEIDELGVFYPDPDHGLRFEPCALSQVFLAYGKDDRALVEQLYDTLETAGFSPWMDVRKLLPGQNWRRAIENAIEDSDFFVACFSTTSARKKGGFQAEIRHALECARQIPLDEIFVVPVRLDECTVPRSIERELQYIDLFPNWQHGLRRLVTMMRREGNRRSAA